MTDTTTNARGLRVHLVKTLSPTHSYDTVGIFNGCILYKISKCCSYETTRPCYSKFDLDL